MNQEGALQSRKTYKISRDDNIAIALSSPASSGEWKFLMVQVIEMRGLEWKLEPIKVRMSHNSQSPELMWTYKPITWGLGPSEQVIP